MLQRKRFIPLLIGATLGLSACSYIKSMFPDKEKDYQFTTEIPPLVLPADLSGGAAGKSTESAPKPNGETIADEALPAETGQAPEAGETPENAAGENGEAPVQAETAAGEADSAQKPAAQTEEQNSDDTPEKTTVELVRFSDGERRLRIYSAPSRAWHLVSKALSRNAIEVTERDQEQKLFHVQFDPDKKKAEDGSLMDEVAFLFKGFETNEKQYLLKLVPVDNASDLAITDKDLNPVPDDPAATKLLRLLGGTLQSE